MYNTRDNVVPPREGGVAALAGVGLKTVSRVVNDVPTVAPDLAERVRAAADKLGYRPNLTASNLRRSDRRTNTIALLVDDLSNPYAATVLRSVEDFFRHRDVLVLAASLDDDPRRERELARTLIDRRVDGLIVMAASGDHRYVVAEQQAGTQFVFIDRAPTPPIADAVLSDNRTGARTAVEHLLTARPRRRVAFLGDRGDIPTARERLSGFHDAMSDAGRRVDDAVLAAQRLLDRIGGDDSPPAVHTVATRLIVRGSGEVGRDPTGRDPTGRDPTGRDPTGRDPTGRDTTKAPGHPGAFARSVDQML